MYWKIVRSYAKLLNILFLMLVCTKIYYICQNVFPDKNFFLLSNKEETGSVFYYDNNSFPYFINNNIDDFSIFDLFADDITNKEHDEDQSNLYRKIISHRLSLVYLFSIFFADIIKKINNLGVI